jgi:hypothetical protein
MDWSRANNLELASWKPRTSFMKDRLIDLADSGSILNSWKNDSYELTYWVYMGLMVSSRLDYMSGYWRG